MQITSNFEWTVQIRGEKISSNRKPLCALPQVLTIVSTLMRVTECLDSMRFCPGNMDEKYFPIQAAKKGVFKNSTGKLLKQVFGLPILLTRDQGQK